MKMKIMDDREETILEDWGEGSGLQIMDTDHLILPSSDNNICSQKDNNIHYHFIIIVLSIVILNLLIISIIICRFTKKIIIFSKS